MRDFYLKEKAMLFCLSRQKSHSASKFHSVNNKLLGSKFKKKSY